MVPSLSKPGPVGYNYDVSLSTGNVLNPVMSDLFSCFDIFWIYNKNPNHETGPNRSRPVQEQESGFASMGWHVSGPVWTGLDRYGLDGSSHQLYTYKIQNNPILDEHSANQFTSHNQIAASTGWNVTGPVWTGLDRLRSHPDENNYRWWLYSRFGSVMKVADEYNIQFTKILSSGPVWTGYGWFQLIYTTVVIIIFILVESTVHISRDPYLYGTKDWLMFY